MGHRITQRWGLFSGNICLLRGKHALRGPQRTGQLWKPLQASFLNDPAPRGTRSGRALPVCAVVPWAAEPTSAPTSIRHGRVSEAPGTISATTCEL